MNPYDAKWFESALNAMSDMIIVKGTGSRLLWGNQTFLDYYQMTSEEMRDVVDGEQSDPDDTLQYVRDDQSVIETADHLDIAQETVTGADGVARIFHTIKSPIVEDGHVVRTIGVSRLIDNPDIKTRAIDHEDAKAFVAPLKTLTGSFPTPMLMVDIKKRAIHSSPLWDQNMGSPGKSPNEFFDKIYPQMSGVSQKISECLVSKERVDELLDMRDDTGGGKVYSVQISPWEYPDGTVGGATVVATDITKLQDRTQALERANDELIQFSYRASHDLKGPLSTTKSLARFIVDDVADSNLDEATQNAARIQKLMSRLENTITSMLSLARSDLSEHEFSRVNLPNMVAHVCESLASQIETSGVQIRTKIELEEFVSQQTRLSQIIENLMSNAIKYHSPGRNDRHVLISSNRTAKGVELCVEDNGVGFPDVDADLIFKLFSRFHKDYEGSGLGLAIVKKHIEALKGKITLERKSIGTRFRMILPLNELLEE